MRGCSWPLSCPSTILAYSCYSSQLVAFCHISRRSLPFSLSKGRFLWNLLFLLFLPYLLLNLFTQHEKFLLLLRFFRNLRTSRSPSWPFLFLSVEFCEICYSFHFCHIFVAQSFDIAGKILVTFAIFAKFADISKPFLTFSLSKYRILWNLSFLLLVPYLLLNPFT